MAQFGPEMILFRKSDSSTSNFYGFYVIFTFFFLSDENNQMKNVKIIKSVKIRCTTIRFDLRNLIRNAPLPENGGPNAFFAEHVIKKVRKNTQDTGTVKVKA